MSRFDLAHVDPTEMGGYDALGKGVEEGKAPPASHYVSKGLTRSRTDKLVVMQGGSGGDAVSSGSAGSNVTSIGGAHAIARGGHHAGDAVASHGPASVGATALDTMAWSRPDARSEPKVDAKAADAKLHAAERRAEAKAKGYEGDSCGECGNFTLVRNGTCMKCDSCGGTSGCS
jgi:ribonucleoside-diphosphate reductase alpha chain